MARYILIVLGLSIIGLLGVLHNTVSGTRGTKVWIFGHEFRETRFCVPDKWRFGSEEQINLLECTLT